MEHLKNRKSYKKWLEEKGAKIDSEDLVIVIKNEIEAADSDAIEIKKTITLRSVGGKIQAQKKDGSFVDFKDLMSEEKEAIAAGFITGDPQPKKKTDTDPIDENPFIFPDESSKDPADKNPFILDD